MKGNKPLIIAAIIAVLLVAFLLIGKKQGWIGSDPSVNVTTEKAEKRTIIESVTASGKIQPETEVKISPDVPGEIIKLPVKEGDKVNKGDLLAKINPDLQEAAVERLEAAMNTSKANLANAKSRLSQVKAQFVNAKAVYERNKKLYEDDVISESEYDAAVSQYEVAKAEVEASKESVRAAEFNVKSAEAALDEASDNLSRTTIYSPVTGTVSKLSVELGERVVGTSQMMGTEIMTLANLNEMEVNVDVNENDIVRVSMGDSALIEVDAYLDREFRGVVTSIANSANVTGAAVDQVTNFEVKIRILQSSYQDLLDPSQPHLSPFRPGMSATVEIQTNTKKDVISVPIQAVTTRAPDAAEKKEKKKRRKGPPKAHEEQEETTAETATEKDEEKECVFLHDNGTAKIRFVETGIQDNQYIEIKSGLEEGDEVVTAPYRQVSKELQDGDAVNKVSREMLYEKEE